MIMAKRKRHFIKRTVFTVYTDYHDASQEMWHYDRSRDAYRDAAQLAHDLHNDQRNFREEDKAHHLELWAAKDYKGVIEHWGEVMSQGTDHLDFIRVTKTTLRVRLSSTGKWKHKAGKQNPEEIYCQGVPTLRRSSVLAEEALRLYAKRTGLSYGGDSEAAASDLLTDLMHLCDREGLTFEDLLSDARNNHTHEIDGRP